MIRARSKRRYAVGGVAALAVTVAALTTVALILRSRSNDSNDGPVSSVTRSGDLAPDAGEQPAVVGRGSDAGMVAIAPQGEDAAASVDHPQVKPDTSGEKAQKATHCQKLEAQNDWQGLRDCATQLSALGARERSEEFRVKAVKETSNALANDKIRKAIRDSNLKEGQRLLRGMGQDSVYWAKLDEAFKTAERPVAEDSKRKAMALVALRDCAALKRFQLQLAGSGLGTANVLTATNVKCVERASSVPPTDPNQARPPSDTSSGTAAQPPTDKKPVPPVPTCETMNIEDLLTQAANRYAAGFSKSALTLVTTALGCKQDVRLYRTAAMYACAAHDAANAKLYFAEVPVQFQGAIIQRCQQEGISLP